MRLRVAMRTTCPYEVVGWAQFAMPWPLEVKLRSSEFNFSSFTKDHRGKTKQKKRTYGSRPPPSGKNLGLNKAQGPPKGHKYQRPEWLLPPFDKQIARGCGRACQCQALIGCVFCIQVVWQIEPITIISASILQPARYGAVTYAVSWWMVDWAIENGRTLPYSASITFRKLGIGLKQHTWLQIKRPTRCPRSNGSKRESLAGSYNDKGISFKRCAS